MRIRLCCSPASWRGVLVLITCLCASATAISASSTPLFIPTTEPSGAANVSVASSSGNPLSHNLTSASNPSSGSLIPVYFSAKEIATIRSNVSAGRQPWAGAYAALIRKANSRLGLAPRSVVDNGAPAGAPDGDRHKYGEDRTYAGDGYVDGDAERQDARAYYTMSAAIYELGLAYLLSGNDAYARKAIDLVYHWCVDSKTFMRPIAYNFSPHSRGGSTHGSVAVYTATTDLVAGASFVLGHPHWRTRGSGAEADFLKWVSDMHASAVQRGGEGTNNFLTRYIEMRAVLAAVMGSGRDVDRAVALWKSHIRFSVKGDGRMHRETGRTRGIHYSMFSIAPFARTAMLARHYGYDLWNWEDGQGIPLKRAFEYMAPFVADRAIPKKWKDAGFQEIGPFKVDEWRGFFEMAYSAYGDRSFGEVAALGSRQTEYSLLYANLSGLGVVSGGGSGTGDRNGGAPSDRDSGNSGGGAEPSPGEEPADNVGGGSGSTRTLVASADAVIRDGSFARENDGRSRSLAVKSSSPNFTRESYIKFTLGNLSIPVRKATIRLHPITVKSNGLVHEAAVVDDVTWREDAITWSNRPDAGAVLASWSPKQGEVVEFDVTSAARSAASRGNAFSIVVRAVSRGGDDDWVHYASRERPSGQPVLVLVLDDGSRREASNSGEGETQSIAQAGDPTSGMPEGFVLDANYPNPFNPTTTISYRLPEGAAVRLDVFNAAGQRVRQLVAGHQPAGNHRVEWDGRDDTGASVASGLYLYRIEAGAFGASRTMILLK
jgi:hypothetical protein